MAAKKPPKPKAFEPDVPDFDIDFGLDDPTYEEDKVLYNPKPSGAFSYNSTGTRAGDIPLLEATKREHLAAKSDLLKQFNAGNETDWGDVIAQALLTIGPMVAGYALDKKQGGIYGADIGLRTGAMYGQNRKEQQQRKRAGIAMQLQNEDAQISAAEKLREEYFGKEADFQNQRTLRSDDRQFEEEKYQNRRGDRLEDLGAQLQMRSQYGGSGKGGAAKPNEALPEFQVGALRQAWEGAGFKWDVEDGYPITSGQAKQMVNLIEQNRLNLGETRRGNEYTGRTTSGILEPIPGQVPNPRNVKVAEETRGAVDNLKLNMQELSGLVSNGVDFTGPEYGQERRKMALLVDGVRRLYDQGANFTEMEKQLNINQLMTLPSEDATQYMIDALRGVDQKQLLDAAIIDFERFAQGVETANKLYNPKRQYLPGTLDRIYQQAPTAAAPGGAKPTLQQFGGDKAAYLQALKTFNNAMRAQHGQ